MDGIQIYYIVVITIALVSSLYSNDGDSIGGILVGQVLFLPVTGRLFGWW